MTDTFGSLTRPLRSSTTMVLDALRTARLTMGTGNDHAISEMADLVAIALGYTNETLWQPTKPDRTPRKLLDVSDLQAARRQPGIPLRAGIEATAALYRADEIRFP